MKNLENQLPLVPSLKINKKSFKIDFEKVKTFEDVISILKAMDLTVTWHYDECPDMFKDINDKGFLIEIK